jgi:hypothetical protein
MKTKHILPSFALLALAASPLRAEGGHDHSAHSEKPGDKHAEHEKVDVKIPETATALWAEISANTKALSVAVAAKQDKTVHTLSMTLEALVAAIPSKHADLPADKAKRVAGQVKNTTRVLDSLHHEADGGHWDDAAKSLTQLEAALKILRQQTGV